MAGIHEVDAMTFLATKMEAPSKKLELLTTSQNIALMMCEGYRGRRTQTDCLNAFGPSSSIEHVNYVGNPTRPGNPYSNSHNPG